LAEKVAGRKVSIAVEITNETAPTSSSSPPAAPALTPTKRASEEDLRQEALTDPAVQALFEIFPVEKSKIEEM
jgi:hypothetical protein